MRNLRISTLAISSVLLLFIAIMFGKPAMADTFKSPQGKDETWTVGASQGNHTFIVDGFWGAERWTRWYRDGQNTNIVDHTYWGNNYTDPTETFYISSSTVIQARVYDKDWVRIQTHTWNVTVDVEGPRAPEPDLLASDDSGYYNIDNYTNVQNPRFSWAEPYDPGSSGVKEYFWAINDNTPHTGGTRTTARSARPSSLSDGVYKLYVCAYDNAGNRGATGWTEFTIDTQNPAKPTRTWPSNGEDITDRTPKFTWASNNDHYTYDITYETNALLDEVTVRGLSETYYQVRTQLRLNETYYWKVQAYDRAGNPSDWNSNWHVFVVKEGPGSLRVTIDPSEARSAGAQWRREGTSTWRNSGDTESNVPAGNQTVQFKPITDWNTPTSIIVNVPSGGTGTGSGTYTYKIGALRVTIEPADARTAGAQWRRVGTSTWRHSGDTESNLRVGSHTVEFTTITGWNKPANITVNVLANATVFEYGTYTRPNGTLRVTIEPADARTAGAQWRRVGTSTWRHSNVGDPDVPAGNHTVEFKTITGWNKPANITVNVPSGGTGTGSGTYTRPNGSLRVTIEPAEARSAGAQWRRVGTSTWRNSGDTESNVPAGNQTVEFKTVTGWNKPANITVNVPSGGTGTGSGTYTRPNGSLRVTIEPAEARSAGAQWRRVGTSTWRNSGDTESNVPAGNQTVEFKTVTGWNKPANITVNVPSGGTGTGSGTYTRPNGSLRVTIEPAEARSAGAQWRRVGTSTWRNSWDTESNVPAGNQTVEFKTISNWNKPANITVNVPPGGTGTGSGIYTLSAHHHSADVDKDWVISLFELTRVLGFYRAGAYHVDSGTSDGYAPGSGSPSGMPHDSDYDPQDWRISLFELTRLLGFYRAGAYHVDGSTSDGFAPGAKTAEPSTLSAHPDILLESLLLEVIEALTE